MRSTYARARDEVHERVAAELLAGAASGLPGNGRLRHHRERLDCLDVRALDEGLRRLAGVEVDGVERLHQRRQRLHGSAHDDRLPVRDSRLEPAGIVRSPDETRVDLVVRLRSAHACEREAVAHFDALDGLDSHQCEGESRVESVGLLRVRTEAGRAAFGDDLDDAAERVAILAGRIRCLPHAVVASRATDLERPLPRR